MFTYTDVTNETTWQGIVDAGAEAAPFTARENNEEVEIITYDDWNPSLYGACEMLRHLRPDGSYTTTGYIRCGTPLVMRVTQIPQNSDKSSTPTPEPGTKK